MASQEKLKSMLMECVREYADQAGVQVAIDENTPLLGSESAVDSLGLVMIVTGFEAKLNDAFDAGIVLANESAMSMRRSPFRSVAALTDYAGQLLQEVKAA